jgi:protein-tyrosine phosphatase
MSPVVVILDRLAGMRPTLYRIPTPAGRLSTMARPRGDDWLDDEMIGLREAGVDVLVSLQSDVERREQGLLDEGPAAQRAGIVFHHFPVPDFGVPDRTEFEPLLATLVAEVSTGRHVAVHCRGGIGRSSVVAAAILVRLGVAPDQAWETISTARGIPVPETDEQRAWPA